MPRNKNESPKRTYIWFFNRRLIFEEGRYVGWYHPCLKEVV